MAKFVFTLAKIELSTKKLTLQKFDRRQKMPEKKKSVVEISIDNCTGQLFKVKRRLTDWLVTS